MTKSRSLYSIINGRRERKPKRYPKTITLRPIPIGHHLAVRMYRKGLFLDTLFVDGIDVCTSYTMIHFNKRLMEAYPVKMIHNTFRFNKLTIWYENNTEFEVIRIS